MQTVSDNPPSLFNAIQSIFGYYQALLHEHSLPQLPLLAPHTLHFVNLFLKENNFARINMDGTIENTESYLPDDILLSKLISTFLHQYCVNNLSATQEQLKFLARLPVTRKRRIEPTKKIPPSIPEGYMGYFLLTKIEDQSANFQDGATPAIASNQGRPQGKTPELRNKIKVSDWSGSEFAKSVRLLYKFYGTHHRRLYCHEEIFDIANLRQFTSSEIKPANILRTFNKFLVVNEFITQVNEILNSIIVTDKQFPVEDRELLKLFQEFKSKYYKKQLPSNVTVADFQRHHAKPAAAGSSNRTAINDEPDQANSFVPD